MARRLRVGATINKVCHVVVAARHTFFPYGSHDRGSLSARTTANAGLADAHAAGGSVLVTLSTHTVLCRSWLLLLVERSGQQRSALNARSSSDALASVADAQTPAQPEKHERAKGWVNQSNASSTQ